MLEFGYILLGLAVSLVLLVGYGYALERSGVSTGVRRRKLLTLAAGLTLWLGYILVLDRSGFLRSFDLPPRFPVLLVLPAFAFIGIVLYKARNSKVLHAIPGSWPVYFQVFRIGIELLFVASVSAGQLHPEVTFRGYNFDILFACSAPVVGFLVFGSRALPRRLALAWNYLGLAVIAFIIALFITTIFMPSLWGSEVPLADPAFIRLPFILVPAFLMPTAVFMHILSIIQLNGGEVKDVR